MTVPTDHPTRIALLDAGLRLLATHDPGQVSVQAITSAAGVAKGTYYVHFSSRDQYFAALHEWWYARLVAQLQAVVTGLPHGPKRLRSGVLAYLDACLRDRMVKVALLATRGARSATGRDPLLDEVAANLGAARHPRPVETARLVAAMVVDVAVVEIGQASPAAELRAALLAMLPSD